MRILFFPRSKVDNYLSAQFETYRQMNGFQLCHYYPGHSLVFRYPDQLGGRVRKYVLEMRNDDREFLVAKMWYGHIGFEADIVRVGDYTVVDMPWLGYDLKEVVKYFKEGKSHDLGFHGFTYGRASELISNTYSLLTDFEGRYNRVHTDFWVPGYDRPLNILLHPDLDFFPFIDAESFASRNTGNVSRFYTNFKLFSNYVMDNLTID